jgi:hypothetical protein
MSQETNRTMTIIGLTTRNRWDGLYNTLHKIKSILPDVGIHVIDDASDSLGDYSKMRDFADITLGLQRRGLVARRNQLVEACDAKYFVSLDDDSYPVGSAENFRQAIVFLDSNPDVAVLTFPIRRLDGSYQVASKSNEPYQTRGYIGCGHMLRVSVFKALGGYDEATIHQGEEFEFSAKAMLAGYKCMHYPAFTIVHEVTPVARSSVRTRYYEARNKIRWAFVFPYTPFGVFNKCSRAIGEQLFLSVKEVTCIRLGGLVAGFYNSIVRGRLRNRKRLSSVQLKYWQCLPPY